MSVLTSGWSKGVGTHSLTKHVPVLTHRQKNGVSTQSLTEKMCCYLLLDRKMVVLTS